MKYYAAWQRFRDHIYSLHAPFTPLPGCALNLPRRCGGCDGRCGPSNGCPCDDCFELLQREVEKAVAVSRVALRNADMSVTDSGGEPPKVINSAGDVVSKGRTDRGRGGFTGLPAAEVFYCGKLKQQCRYCNILAHTLQADSRLTT